MRKQFVLSAAGLFLGTALSSAQPPAVTAGPLGQTGDATAYQQQLVTVEGCLHRERAPEGHASELAADTSSRLMFLLLNAEVRSRTDVVPGSASSAGEAALGPADLQNREAGVRTGKGEEVETAAPTGSPTPGAERYIVMGLADERLKLFTGQRVLLTGQFEPSAANTADTAGTSGAPQARPEGVRESGTARGGEGVPTGTSGGVGAALNLPRFVATSVKPVAGICPPKP